MVTWLGGSGDWETSTSWSSLAVPNDVQTDIVIGSSPTGLSSVKLHTQASIGQLTVNVGDALTLNNGGLLILNGGVIDNRGTVSLSASGAAARIALAADTVLSGAGQTLLGNDPGNALTSIGGSHVLTIDSLHTVRGGGNLGSSVYGALDVVNKGTVIAEAPGGMTTFGSSFDNHGGTVQIAAGSSFNLSAGIFAGGVITGSGNASFGGAGVYTNLTLAGNLGITNTRSAHISGNIVNQGSLSLQDSASLILNGDTTLSGSGQMVIANGTSGGIYGNSAGPTVLTIGAGYTVRGGGTLGSTFLGGVNVVNRGTVIAEAASGMESFVGSFDNQAGLISIANGSAFRLTGGVLSGGTIQGTGSAVLSGTGTYRDLTLTGNLTTGRDITIAALGGTITNQGSLLIAGSSPQSPGYVRIAADTTLAGTGQTVLSNGVIQGTQGSSSHLTIESGHTLRGSGVVGQYLDVVNKGLIIAEGASGFVASGTSFDNSAGVIQVADGSAFGAGADVFSGGVIRSAGNGSLSGGGTMRDVVLEGNFKINNGLQIGGTVTNNGALTLASGQFITLGSDATLDGTGQIVFSPGAFTEVINKGSEARTLTIGAGQTLRGDVQLGDPFFGMLNVVNKGTIIAESGLPGSQALSFDNRGGLIQIADGMSFTFRGVTLSGGRIQSLGNATLDGSGIYRDVTLLGPMALAPTSQVQVAGKITVQDSLNLGSSSFGSPVLHLAGDTTLSGSGQTVLSPNAIDINIQNSDFTTKTLTIDAGHTLRGVGSVGGLGTINVINNGTILADGSSGNHVLAFGNSTLPLVNHGLLLASEQGSLSAGSILQDSANAEMRVLGNLGASVITLQAGLLRGTGTVGGVINSTGGTISAGIDVGQLNIAGQLNLGDASTLKVDVAGLSQGSLYDWLAVTGNVSLNGDVHFDFGSFIPQVGERFTFLTFAGSKTGNFDSVSADGYQLSLSYTDHAAVATIAGISAVPEPADWMLWLAGAALLGLAQPAVRSRRRG